MKIKLLANAHAIADKLVDEYPEIGGAINEMLDNIETTFRRLLWLHLAIVAVALVALGWAFRWQTIPGKSGEPIYLMNRWTGTFIVLTGGEWANVKQQKEE